MPSCRSAIIRGVAYTFFHSFPRSTVKGVGRWHEFYQLVYTLFYRSNSLFYRSTGGGRVHKSRRWPMGRPQRAIQVPRDTSVSDAVITFVFRTGARSSRPQHFRTGWRHGLFFQFGSGRFPTVCHVTDLWVFTLQTTFHRLVASHTIRRHPYLPRGVTGRVALFATSLIRCLPWDDGTNKHFGNGPHLFNGVAMLQSPTNGNLDIMTPITKISRFFLLFRHTACHIVRDSRPL